MKLFYCLFLPASFLVVPLYGALAPQEEQKESYVSDSCSQPIEAEKKKTGLLLDSLIDSEKEVRSGHHVNFRGKIEMLQSTVHSLVEIAWVATGGYLHFLDANQVQVQQKEDASKNISKPDWIFWPKGSEHWSWRSSGEDKENKRPNNIHHKPGYEEDMIEYLIKKDQSLTHLILSTGWIDALFVLGKKRGSIDEKELQNTVKIRLSGSKTIRTLQKFTSYADLASSGNEVVVLALDTKNAALAYNHLIQEKKNRIVAAFHTTC